jgi:hypothetical protein
VKRYAEAPESDKRLGVVEGFVYGSNSRLIFPCVVSFGEISRWVFFVAATGVPHTYLSSKASTTTITP